MANLQTIIESIKERLVLDEIYTMPDAEVAEYQAKIDKAGMNKDHAGVLMYLVRGKHFNSPRKACPARECEKIAGKKALDDLIGLKLVAPVKAGGRTTGYYATMDGFLIGNGLIRRQLKV